LNYKIEVDHIGKEAVRPFKTMISSNAPLECDFGDRFYCVAHFYVPKSSYFFDSKQYYYSRGIYINAYVKNPDETYTSKNAENGLKYHVIKLRSKMLEASKNFLSEDIASIQNGIFLGERNSIENVQRINFLKNGIYHLICTSGIHISIIMAGFLWLFKYMKLSEKLAHLLTIIPLFAFVLMTGFSLSAVRAGIMCTIYLLSVALSKKPDRLNSIGFSVFSICLVNPNSALGLGLWLSASAVLGITLFSKKIFSFLASKLNKKALGNPVIKAVLSAVSISFATGVFTAPLTIFYSRIFSLVGFFSNIIFIPLTTVILVSALMLSVLWVFGVPKLVMYPFAFVSGMGVKFFTKLSEFLAAIPFCYVSLDYPFIEFWLGIIILTLAVCLVFFKTAKALVCSVSIAVASLICGIFSYQIFSFNSAQISLINGSEGVACVLRKNNHTACISCFGEKNYIKNFENFLECSGIEGIDYFAVTSSENLPDKFIKNTIKNHKINCFILPSQSADCILLGESGVTPIYFDTQLHSDMWGGELMIDSFATHDCTYTKINIDNIDILIMPGGGDANDIPESERNCDILLSYGIPKNFGNINCQSVVIYGQ
ncbi:MAG: ComEC/Rec2 family competence protein, partial [Clostridia bacterium]|nr:ComEC/Rec2 family competence protein [Clostridia bacterium]MBR2734900.1 ComEC/Rec2 family competence protein [Clostridia bacterium]